MTSLLPGTPVLLGFLGATLAVLAVPGPSVVHAVARAGAHGRRAGLWSVLGLETGATLHVVAAVGGLAALVARSPLLFDAVRWAGVAYLAWLGVRSLWGTGGSGGEGRDRPARPSRWRLYADGTLVDLLNPKTAIFFVAFLPQFVDPVRGPTAGQLTALGLIFVVLAALIDSTYVLLTDRLSRRMRESDRGLRRMNQACGGTYLVLAGVAVVV